MALFPMWEAGGENAYDHGPHRFGSTAVINAGELPGWERDQHGIAAYFYQDGTDADLWRVREWGTNVVTSNWHNDEAYSILCVFRSDATSDNERRVWQLSNGEHSLNYNVVGGGTPFMRFTQHDGTNPYNLLMSPNTLAEIARPEGHAVCCCIDENISKFVALNGVVDASTTSNIGVGHTSVSNIQIGGHSNNKTGNSHVGTIGLWAMWNRRLSEEEACELTRDPWQLIRPARHRKHQPRTLTPTPLAQKLEIAAPTLLSPISLAVSPLGTATTLPAHTAVPGAVTISVNPIGVAAGIPAQTLVPGTVALSVTPAGLQVSIPAQAIDYGNTLAVQPLAAGMTIPSATIIPGATSVPVTPITVEITIPAQSIVTGDDRILPVSPLGLEISIPQGTAQGGAITITVDPLLVELILAAASAVKVDIDGSASISLTGQYDVAIVTSDGSNWWILHKD